MNSLSKILIVTILFASCMPTEDPVDPYPRGDRQEVLINSGDNKNSVNFYSLDDQVLVQTADPMDWDVFVANDKFMINVFRHLYVAEYDGDLRTKLDTVGLTFTHMQADSAMWQLQPDVDYVLDLGKNNAFEHQGFHKLRFTEQGNNMFIQHSTLEKDVWLTMSLEEGEYANLRSDRKVDLPAFGTYDLMLGKYTHYFEIEETLYEVFGALSLDAEVAITSEPFESIGVSSLDSLAWSMKYDAIGYDWKSYNLNKGAYEIDSDKVYIIRSDQGYVYKMRFTNFYDNSGTSGHPTFEFELI